jgi:hypothetical protein
MNNSSLGISFIASQRIFSDSQHPYNSAVSNDLIPASKAILIAATHTSKFSGSASTLHPSFQVPYDISAIENPDFSFFCFIVLIQSTIFSKDIPHLQIHLKMS